MTVDKQDNQKKTNNNKPGGNKKPPKNKFSAYWIYGLVLAVILGMQFFNFGTGPVEISSNEFEKMMMDGDISKIDVINKSKAEIYIIRDSISNEEHQKLRNKGFSESSEGPHYTFEIAIESFKEELDAIYKRKVMRDTMGKDPYKKREILLHQDRVNINYKTRRDWSGEILSWVIPFGLLILLWIFLMRRMSGGAGGGQIFNFGKSKAQLFDQKTHVKIDFSDVAGLDEAKVEVMEIVDFLKNPKRYTELGGKIPKGALLVGPPGTGKTLLAKAVAGEAKVPFFSMSGSDFVEMFVGVGASRVRDLFKQAKEKAPCIVFIDEIDAIGRSRGKNPMTGANDERENTLNQLLTEMDGFGSNVGVIILAATNRADVLDRALLRAGRFDRQIHVELPDLEGRKAIFKVHMRPLKIDTNTDIDFLAKQTPGFSGADIANVCNESALIAARKDKKSIDKQDFMDAIDRIIGGLEKRSKIISPHEKKVIAFHESGHAAVSWLTKYSNPLVKVTIVPRGKALGAAWYLPEERQITTYAQMYDELTSALGGRAAEESFFSEISTGALNDLEKVTKQAYAMVAYLGLNEKVGNISYYDSTGQQEYSLTKPYSEKTAETIDKEVSNMIESAYQRAKNIIQKNKKEIQSLAEYLLEKEVIFKEDVERFLGKRPFQPEQKAIQNANLEKANTEPSQKGNEDNQNEKPQNN